VRKKTGAVVGTEQGLKPDACFAAFRPDCGRALVTKRGANGVFPQLVKPQVLFAFCGTAEVVPWLQSAAPMGFFRSL
jgi:hypothetical protein